MEKAEFPDSSLKHLQLKFTKNQGLSNVICKLFHSKITSLL